MATQPGFELLQSTFEQIRYELAKCLVGCDAFIEQLMITLLAGGHCLLEAPPGTAKSLVTASFARVTGLSFDHVRCTPDLLPSDLIGLGAQPRGSLEIPGPLFANLVLAADIERLSPRADSLLQQAIQEQRVVKEGRQHTLPDPFMVVATQFPIHDGHESSAERTVIEEYHDDRFMLKIKLAYPDESEEFQLATRLSAVQLESPEQIVGVDGLRDFRALVRTVNASADVVNYILRLIRSTRVHEGETPDFIYEWVDFGAGPRATHHLTLAAKVRAALYGRDAVTFEDVRSVAHPILRHRIITNRNARSTGVTVDRVIKRLLYEIAESDETERGMI
ncbi:MAG: MoxR family ATPase [Planctomycetaceae bacterium]|nr:MoxR family ATPase [Planctomycetales bacterium]MCB9925746.1 MoxR family ATPase [Planctomycetaceae bacterium]